MVTIHRMEYEVYIPTRKVKGAMGWTLYLKLMWQVLIYSPPSMRLYLETVLCLFVCFLEIIKLKWGHECIFKKLDVKTCMWDDVERHRKKLNIQAEEKNLEYILPSKLSEGTNPANTHSYNFVLQNKSRHWDSEYILFI